MLFHGLVLGSELVHAESSLHTICIGEGCHGANDKVIAGHGGLGPPPHSTIPPTQLQWEAHGAPLTLSQAGCGHLVAWGYQTELST